LFVILKTISNADILELFPKLWSHVHRLTPFCHSHTIYYFLINIPLNPPNRQLAFFFFLPPLASPLVIICINSRVWCANNLRFPPYIKINTKDLKQT
jgi:hypothetical protein